MSVPRFEICVGLECSILQHCRCHRLVDSGYQEDEASICKALKRCTPIKGDVMQEENSDRCLDVYDLKS